MDSIDAELVLRIFDEVADLFAREVDTGGAEDADAVQSMNAMFGNLGRNLRAAVGTNGRLCTVGNAADVEALGDVLHAFGTFRLPPNPP